MKNLIKGNPEFTREINQKLILNLIRTYGSLSRAELAEKSKLSAPTVSDIVDTLMEEGFIKEVGLGASSGGRRPVLLEINQTGLSMIGIDISPEKIKIALTNLDLSIKHALQIPIDPMIPKELIIHHLLNATKELLSKEGVKREKILGIGISSPGQIDSQRGFIHFSNTIKNWNNVPLKEIFETEIAIPTYVQHNVKAMAIRELWFGENGQPKDFIVIKAGIGIGAGIVTNGKIYRGSSGKSGEFGHTFVSFDGPECKCGNHGCLESYADLVAIKKKIKELARKERIDKWQLETIENEALLRALEEKDPLVLQVFGEAGRYLGIGIVNLIHLFNPELILFGGEMARFWPYLEQPIMQIIEQRAISSLKNTVKIKPITNNLEISDMQSAAAIVFDHEFQTPVHK